MCPYKGGGEAQLLTGMAWTMGWRIIATQTQPSPQFHDMKYVFFLVILSMNVYGLS